MNARGQHPREAEVLNALYLKVDAGAVEKAEAALCQILDERHAAITEQDALAAEVAALRADRDALLDKLRSSYAYRESMEGLPPGTLTSKVDALAVPSVDEEDVSALRHWVTYRSGNSYACRCAIGHDHDGADDLTLERTTPVPSVDATAPCEFGCGWDDDPQYARPGFTVVAGCPVHSDREGVAELPPASALAGATPHDTAASEKAAKDAAYAALIEDGPDDIRNMRPSVDATAEATDA